jgi:hypothetical protein
MFLSACGDTGPADADFSTDPFRDEHDLDEHERSSDDSPKEEQDLDEQEADSALTQLRGRGSIERRRELGGRSCEDQSSE